MIKNNDIDIVLVMCPLLQSTEPHIAIPLLAKCLQEQGYRVLKRDLSLEFYKKLKDPISLKFLKILLGKRERHLRQDGLSTETYQDYARLQIAFAALDSLQEGYSQPLRIEQWNAFCRKAFSIQGAFGFNTVIQNDFHEFLDDLFSFLQVDHFPRDTRLGFERRSTISEVITSKHLTNTKTNLFLEVYEHFFLDSLLSPDPLAIGLSIPTNEQILQALSLAFLIKKKAPHIHITAGGSYIRYLEDDQITHLLKLNVIDSIVTSRGDKLLPRIIKALQNKESVKLISGLVCKEKVEESYLPYKRSTKEEIYEPRWNIIPDYSGLRSLCKDNRALGVLVSEGCPWGKCTYCNYTGIRGYLRRPLFKPPDLLVEEMTWLQKEHSINQFNLISDSIPPEYAHSLSDLILSQGLNVEMSIWARGERGFSLELCEKMKQAGFHYVTLGVESLCQRTLKRMKKGTSIKSNLETMRNMVSAGLLVQVNIIIGFPGETMEEARETFEILQQEMNREPVYRVVVFPFSVQRKSKIHCSPSRFGITLSSHPAKDFQPKNIFVPFQYTDGSKFEEVYALAMKYQNHLNIEWEKYRDQQYPLSPDMGINSQDFILQNGDMKRIPSWLLVNFSTGIVHNLPLSTGYLLSNSRKIKLG